MEIWILIPIMPFKTKKIKIETLSEYLLGVRKQQNFSLEDVSDSTGIPVKFLLSLEAGNFFALPPSVYVRGFLKKIAELYKIPESTLIEQFKKERSLSQEIIKYQNPQLSKAKTWLSKLVVTPKLLSLSAAALFVFVTIGYIFFQVTSIYGTPKLIVSEPKDGQKISSSAVAVSGQTDPGTSLTINDQLILVNPETGNFNAMVSVNPGQKDLSFVASNKFKKINSKKVSILVDIQVANSEQASKQNSKLKLGLNFTEATSIITTIDNGEPVSENLAAGSSKIISATETILLSTSNAGATIVTLNDKQLGALGKKNEKLSNVPFSLEMVNALAKSSSQETVKKPTQN
jgi:cytoskeletal protein RodZ